MLHARCLEEDQLKASKWGLAVVLAIGSVALAACGGSDSESVSNEGNEDLFTTAGFTDAYDAAKEKAGNDAELLEVRITGGGAEFTLKSGEEATGFIYTGGELHDQEVTLVGPGSIEGTQFPMAEVDPAAIDKIVDGVSNESGISDIKVQVMTLDKKNVEGTLRWTINAEGGGRTGLVYNADPDGSNVTSPLGDIATGTGTSSGTTATEPSATTGGVTAPNGKTPQEIADCIRNAGGDVTKIQACAQ